MTMRGEIICHSQKHFEAAFAAISLVNVSTNPIVRTAPNAAAYAGVLYLKMATLHSESTPAETQCVVLDCGSAPSLVLSGLHLGWLNFAFKGPASIQEKISQLVSKREAQLVDINRGPILDLHSAYDPLKKCSTWLHRLDRSEVAG